MNYEFRITNWALTRGVLLICALSLVICNSSFLMAQQPQAPAGTPLYSVNAKYVNGMAPGYWPTPGSGLTLIVSAGTAYCGNPPSPVSFGGGTLALNPSATNYVYLNPAASCAPAVNTTGFSAGYVPIAKVVTGASSINTVTDERTWSNPNPAAVSSSGAVHISALGTNQDITLSPSGTGVSVVNNLADKGGQVFNIKAYGAKGDGTTNDSPAFQAAYNAAVSAGGGTVYVPPTSSCYLFNDPINMTGSGSPQRGVTIQGAGKKMYGVGTGATGTICGNTGGIVFDVTGSTEITFDNINVTSQKSGLSNPSLIGLYVARDSSGLGAQNIKVLDSTFSMILHTSGSTYSFGAYLYGSEEDRFDRDNLIADFPLVVSSTNAFNRNSAFVTQASGAQSEASGYFNNMELTTAGLGPAAYFSSTGGMTLTGHSWNFSHSSSYPAGLYKYALEFLGGNASMNIRWHQEGFPGWAYIQLGMYASQLYGIDAPAGSPPAHAIEFEDASSQLVNTTFNIKDSYSSPSSNAYYDSTEGSIPGVIVMDNVTFFCGEQTNCGDIPVGNYVPGGTTAYVNNVHWSGSENNPNPSFKMSGSGIITRFEDRVAGTPATISYGRGAPSGACQTPSLYLNTTGGSGTTFYVCESGAWIAK